MGIGGRRRPSLGGPPSGARFNGAADGDRRKVGLEDVDALLDRGASTEPPMGIGGRSSRATGGMTHTCGPVCERWCATHMANTARATSSGDHVRK